MSGAQTSTFPSQNILYDMATGATGMALQSSQNTLLKQQQDISDHDIAMTGQAAAPLLGMSEEDAAAAYPGVIQQLKAMGGAKYAPPTYPGHAATQALVQRAMPLMDQFKLGYITPPGTQAAIDAALRPGTTGTTGVGQGMAGGTGGAAAPSVPAYGGGTGNLSVPQEYMPYFQEASQRTGIPVDVLIAQARQESGFNPGATGGAGEIGIMQIHPKTAASPGFGMTGVQNPDALRDPRTNINFGADYLAARGKAVGADLTTPQGQAAALHAYNGGGDPNYVANVFRYVPPGGPAVATAGAPGSTTAARPPVVTGDSLASPAGLGGSGVKNLSSAAVLANVRADSRAGKYDGKPVVLSTGASNDFGSDLGSVEQQIREAQGGNAGKITVLGVGPAVEAKAPGTNAKLAALAKSYGADFVPLPADQMSPDGVHPTAQGYATLKAAIAPRQGAPGGPTADGRYQVASNAPVAPPASTAAPAPLPRDQAVVQAQRTGQAVPVAGVDGLWALPNGNLTGTPPAQAQPAPQPQAQVPQPPANRAMPGGPDGPPAATPPPAQQQPPPGARANLPRAADIPTGVNSQQYRDAADLQRRALILEAQVDPTGRLKQLAAGLRQQAQLLLQTDSVVQTQEGQLHPLTGQIGDPTKPLADYHETSPGSGIWVGGPGTEPRFQPPGRLVVTPGGDVYQTTSGGPVLLKRTDPQAVAALEEAKASGAATGTATAKQLPELMATARNAAAQEGQIDYAANQLREAAKGGVPSGYFSPGLAIAAAAAKSLGIDTSALGINPEAVGNVQTAQKTLSVIGGAILRQALGPGSAITEGKIEQFIHTQPGLETDPQALQRIMAWARSQYTYERELGHAAVSEAAKPENAGRLPPHWLPAYYRDHGFAPIYDPGTQEMRQPDGTQPSRETPPAQPAQATSPAAALPPAAVSRLKENVTTTFTNGQQWTLRNGQPMRVK